MDRDIPIKIVKKEEKNIIMVLGMEEIKIKRKRGKKKGGNPYDKA